MLQHAASDINVSGLPRTGDSGAGERLFEEGSTYAVYCMWAKKHIEERTVLIILENTPAPCIFNLCFSLALNESGTTAEVMWLAVVIMYASVMLCRNRSGTNIQSNLQGLQAFLLLGAISKNRLRSQVRQN